MPDLARMQTFDNRVAAERRSVFRAPTLSGSSLALLFWWQSLTPSLIPRSWPMQTAVGAICLAIGYAIGTLAGRSLYRLLEQWKRLRYEAVAHGTLRWPQPVLDAKILNPREFALVIRHHSAT